MNMRRVPQHWCGHAEKLICVACSWHVRDTWHLIEAVMSASGCVESEGLTAILVPEQPSE